MADGCCTPDATRLGNDARVGAPPGTRPAARATVGGAHDDGRPMCELPATTFLMGTAASDGFPADGEGPVREVSLSGFAIDLCAVSIDDFAACRSIPRYGRVQATLVPTSAFEEDSKDW